MLESSPRPGDSSAVPGEQAVLVWLRLADDHFGSTEDHEQLEELARRLEHVVRDSGCGEFDGDEVGLGWATLYLYSKDADRLLDAILPLVRAYPVRQGSYVVKHYGPPGCRENRMLLSQEYV